MSLAFRPVEGEDLAFVVRSWAKSFREANSAGLIAMDDWRDVMEPQIVKVLARPGCEVFVAYHPGEEDRTVDLYGWIAVERGHAVPFVLYCYVKHAFRRMSIARRLFEVAGVNPEAEFQYACKTGVVRKLARSIPRARWRPLAARFPRRTKELNVEERSHRRG
jgi:GNAT superfamily N-acetyltransferase